MNSWKVILATVVIFGAGVLTGGLLVNYVDRSHPRNFHRPPDEAASHSPQENHDRGQPRPQDVPRQPQADRLSKQFLQQLDDTLRLTPEQHEKIAKVIADGQERNHALWTNVAPQMRKVMQEVNQQIHEELTPEQQKQFEVLIKRYVPRHSSPTTNAPSASLVATNLPSPAPGN